MAPAERLAKPSARVYGGVRGSGMSLVLNTTSSSRGRSYPGQQPAHPRVDFNYGPVQGEHR